ncbi:hypothetical protein [Paludisphaera soli]|uniref:hypothetical protein n=1 Tax=Paludisphaera soli TaxID=2712865 RepID=UPI0013EAA9C1|nr:hypothetical protein [Paludisphaera soli]
MNRLDRALFLLLAGAIGFSTSPGRAEEGKPGSAIRNGELTAEELADFLGVGSWVFEYEGGRPRCWLEVEEAGQKTVSQKRVMQVEESNKGPEARRGKVLFFLRRGDLQLRINSGASRGGAGVALPADALWWGWPSFSGSTTRLEKPAAPRPGEEVVLLRHETEEPRQDGKDPRKVVLTLKMTVEDE